MVKIDSGIELCRILHEKLRPIGIFPALTGGLLYKDGLRKDIDIVLYRHRQDVKSFETSDIEFVLNSCGVNINKFCGFVTKAEWKGFTVDLFNPETQSESDEYEDE